MAEQSNVLFVRGNEHSTASDSDDVWDDSALIKAYDKAVNLAKEEVMKRMGTQATKSQTKQKPDHSSHSHNPHKSSKKWSEGAPCRAIYSEDGKVYEAIITKMYENSGTCTVKFIGYGNTEKVPINSLLESEGLQSQIAQQKIASAEKDNEDNLNSTSSAFPSHSNCKKFNRSRAEKMDCDTDENKSFKQNFMHGSLFNLPHDIIPPAPPLPPQLMAKLPENDADALSSMLISWYINGFHTGYYYGLTQAKNTQEKRRNL